MKKLGTLYCYQIQAGWLNFVSLLLTMIWRADDALKRLTAK